MNADLKLCDYRYRNGTSKVLAIVIVIDKPWNDAEEEKIEITLAIAHTLA